MSKNTKTEIIPQQIAAPDGAYKKSRGAHKDYKAQPQDPNEPVTELDGIRKKVFLDRYALKGEEGELLESTPEEMWHRVAWGIAQAEDKKNQKEWEDKFYSLMKDFKFVPAGRILSGAGTSYDVTYFNCLPPYQEILTPQGYKPIKDIKVGDLVITGKKRARKVTNVFKRETKEPIYIIKPLKLGFDNVRLTGEHPVLAIRKDWVNSHRSRDGLHLKEEPKWIKASELKKGDFVSVAWNQQIKVLSELHVSDYLPDTFSVKDDYVFKEKLHKVINNRLHLDEDLMLLMGTWLGDGCVTHRSRTNIPVGIQITFNKVQSEWANEIAKIIEKKFSVIPTVREDRWGQNLIQVRADSYALGLFFNNFFGAYSYGKTIPQTIMEQPSQMVEPLLKGIFRSDGYLSNNYLGFAISNKTLAIQLHQLLLKTGRFFTIFENNAKNGKHDTYRVTAGISQTNGLSEYVFGEKKTNKHHNQSYYLDYNDLYWVRIGDIDKVPYEGEVHDIEVDEDHSFITGGIVVSNCFVIPSPKDSRNGILESLKQLVEIQSRAGGVGLNLSSLRPRGARVKKVNGVSSGPITWAGLFSYATHDVVQQGGSRRGATMLMLWDWHPDVEEFITVKQDLSKINGANLSVCVSDAFMEAVKKDGDWDLVYPDLDDPEYDEKWDGEIDRWKAMGKKVKVYKTVKAKYLWNLICEAAWRSAEPGLHFLDRSNKRSNTWYFERLTSTNPCGEQPLGPWAVCNLGAMNLASYVKDEQFDFDRFGSDAKVAMRFLDNVIDQTYYFFPENEVCAKDIRRTGLGIMGLADALIMMKVKYGSEESLPIIRKIFETLRNNAYDASSDIAVEKGAFPKFDKEKYLEGYHIKNLPQYLQDKIAKQGIRNAVLLTIAPTGTTSLLSGVSSGVEPVYEFEFIRRDRMGEHKMYHPLFDTWRETHPDEKRPDYFVSANDLTPLEHVKVQAVAQEYIDSSISKTVNAPNHHTVDDVQNLYMSAYDMGLKGVTYMRDGSREGVLTRVEEKKEEKAPEVKEVSLKRPMMLQGRTYKLQTPVGEAFITINRDELNQPLEVFATIGKGGMHIGADAEAIGRMISLALRTNPKNRREVAGKIVAQLANIGGSSQVGFGKGRVMSLADAIAKVLAEDLAVTENENPATMPLDLTASATPHSNGVAHTNGVAKHEIDSDIHASQLSLENLAGIVQKSGDICPDCGNATLIYEEGCSKCYTCGYSKC